MNLELVYELRIVQPLSSATITDVEFGCHPVSKLKTSFAINIYTTFAGARCEN